MPDRPRAIRALKTIENLVGATGDAVPEYDTAPKRGYARAIVAAECRAIGRSVEGAESARREIEKANGEALAYSADVSDPTAINSAADEIAEWCGAIDVWINNAMVTMFAPLSQMSPGEFRWITEVTYLGCVHGTMAALRHMRARNQGTIIQVGSALSYRAIPLQSAYCGAKFAVRGFTDSLRSELFRDKSNVRITMVQLPAVNTPQFDWARNRFSTRPQPLPPIFQPEAIADKIYAVARRPPRELRIGLSTLKAIVGSIAAPAWLDHYLARSGYDGQFTKERVSQDAVDNLFEAAPFGHVVQGRFSDRAKRSVVGIRSESARMVAVFLLILLLVSVAAFVYFGTSR